MSKLKKHVRSHIAFYEEVSAGRRSLVSTNALIGVVVPWAFVVLWIVLLVLVNRQAAAGPTEPEEVRSSRPRPVEKVGYEARTRSRTSWFRNQAS
jgi:hypothetical protein